MSLAKIVKKLSTELIEVLVICGDDDVPGTDDEDEFDVGNKILFDDEDFEYGEEDSGL